MCRKCKPNTTEGGAVSQLVQKGEVEYKNVCSIEMRVLRETIISVREPSNSDPPRTHLRLRAHVNT